MPMIDSSPKSLLTSNMFVTSKILCRLIGIYILSYPLPARGIFADFQQNSDAPDALTWGVEHIVRRG